MKVRNFITSTLNSLFIISAFAAMVVRRTDNKYRKGQTVYINGELSAVISDVPSWLVLTDYKLKYFDKTGALHTVMLSEKELNSLVEK